MRSNRGKEREKESVREGERKIFVFFFKDKEREWIDIKEKARKMKIIIEKFKGVKF